MNRLKIFLKVWVAMLGILGVVFGGLAGGVALFESKFAEEHPYKFYGIIFTVITAVIAALITFDFDRNGREKS